MRVATTKPAPDITSAAAIEEAAPTSEPASPAAAPPPAAPSPAAPPAKVVVPQLPAPATPAAHRYDPVTEPPLISGIDGLRVERTWGDQRELQREFIKYAKQFKTTSIFRYAAMAAHFYQQAPKYGFETKVDADGVIRIYDSGSNTYGEYNPDGTARTFMRPERGSAFFAEQPGVPPIAPEDVAPATP
jgi:pyocin large subunit-like protein